MIKKDHICLYILKEYVLFSKIKVKLQYNVKKNV